MKFNIIDTVISLEHFISEREKVEIVKYVVAITDEPTTIKKILGIVMDAYNFEKAKP